LAAYIEKPLAFLWRDFINDKSYKFAFSTQLVGILVTTLTFFFLSALLGETGISYLKPYGGSYFSFVLIGIALYNYLKVSMMDISKSIRDGQMLGTLEALLVTQTGVSTIILSSSLYSYLLATLRVVVYFLLGIFVFGIHIGNANLTGAFVILILTIGSFSSLGIISASFVMVLKKGDPVSLLFASISGLLGGVYFPISVLPDWLKIFSYLIPVTYSLEGMRMALLKGYSFQELMPYIMALFVFSAIMIPLSLWIFVKAVKRAKRDGTLTQY